MYTKSELETIYKEYYFHCGDITNGEYDSSTVQEVLSDISLLAFLIMSEPDAAKTQIMAKRFKDFIVMNHKMIFDQLENEPDIKSYPCPCLRKQIKETYDSIEKEIEEYDEDDMSSPPCPKLKELLKKIEKYEGML